MEHETSIAFSPETTNNTWSAPVRVFGHIVSFIFHPLFIPSFIAAFILYADPYAFAGMNDKAKIFKLVSVAFSTAFLPLFSVLLMKQLGFIQSIFLRSQKDRIIPYIVCMIILFLGLVCFKKPARQPFTYGYVAGGLLIMHCRYDG